MWVALKYTLFQKPPSRSFVRYWVNQAACWHIGGAISSSQGASAQRKCYGDPALVNMQAESNMLRYVISSEWNMSECQALIAEKPWACCHSGHETSQVGEARRLCLGTQQAVAKCSEASTYNDAWKHDRFKAMTGCRSADMMLSYACFIATLLENSAWSTATAESVDALATATLYCRYVYIINSGLMWKQAHKNLPRHDGIEEQIAWQRMPTHRVDIDLDEAP